MPSPSFFRLQSNKITMPKIRHPKRIGKCYKLDCIMYVRSRTSEGHLDNGQMRYDLWGKFALVVGTTQWYGEQLEILLSKPNGESEIVYIEEAAFAEMHAYRRIKQVS